jgi:hypothetical protein
MIMAAPLVQGSCILRKVINYSDRAQVELLLFRPVPGAREIRGGIRIPTRPRPQVDPVVVPIEQTTGNEMIVRVVEDNIFGKICKEYFLKIDEQTGKMDFSKREACLSTFGEDRLIPTQQLPDNCYIDLELRNDVNGLSLKVLPGIEVNLLLQEREKQERQALQNLKKKMAAEKSQDPDELSPL